MEPRLANIKGYAWGDGEFFLDQGKVANFPRRNLIDIGGGSGAIVSRRLVILEDAWGFPSHMVLTPKPRNLMQRSNPLDANTVPLQLALDERYQRDSLDLPLATLTTVPPGGVIMGENNVRFFDTEIVRVLDLVPNADGLATVSSLAYSRQFFRPRSRLSVSYIDLRLRTKQSFC